MFKGEKVILRPMQREDLARQFVFDNDPELAGLDCGTPAMVSMERLETQFEENSRKQDSNTAWFAIEADGKYIGSAALLNLQDRFGNLELGVVIGDREYWGRGYGRDTVKLLLHYAFHYFGARRVAMTSHAKNERALRCWRACGFVEEGRPRKVLWIEGEYVDLVNMSILREEWEANNA